jgi:hypothetical protein
MLPQRATALELGTGSLGVAGPGKAFGQPAQL